MAQQTETMQQTETILSEAEAIRQAKDGAAAAVEYLYKLHCGRVCSFPMKVDAAKPGTLPSWLQPSLVRLELFLTQRLSVSRCNGWKVRR